METEIILCDTDTIIEVINNNTELIYFLEDLGIDSLIISSITRAEVQQGARNKRHLSKMNRELNKFPVIDIDDSISRCFSRLFEQFILSHKCGIPDIINAASAIVYDLPFMTMNLKDFKYIPGLRLIPHNIKPKRNTGFL